MGEGEKEKLTPQCKSEAKKMNYQREEHAIPDMPTSFSSIYHLHIEEGTKNSSIDDNIWIKESKESSQKWLASYLFLFHTLFSRKKGIQ